jgi:hypothetical protein
MESTTTVSQIRGSAPKDIIRSEATCDTEINPRPTFPVGKDNVLPGLCKAIFPGFQRLRIQFGIEVSARQRNFTVP